MPWIHKDKLPISWTSVPSGVVDGTLSLKVIVAPRVSEDAASQTILKEVFSQWPSVVRRELRTLSVFFRTNSGVQVGPIEAPAELGEIVDDNIWRSAFPSLNVRDENRKKPEALFVDEELGSSYDAIKAEREVSSRRLMQIIASSMPERNVQEYLQKLSVQSAIDVSESLLCMFGPEKHGDWAQAPVALGILRAEMLELDDRVKKLRDRNKFRLSPNGSLRKGADQILRLRQHGDSNSRYHALAQDGVTNCVTFNSRVKSLQSDKPGPVRNETDFAERLGLVREYPYLAARLGLTLEVRVPLAQLKDQKEVLEAGRAHVSQLRVWVTPTWNRPNVSIVNPGTLSDLDIDREIFFASEASSDGKSVDEDHIDGHLRLDSGKWKLTTMDVDGASIKYANYAVNKREITPMWVTDRRGVVLHANYGAESLLAGKQRRFEPGASMQDFVELPKEIEDTIQDLEDAEVPCRPIPRTIEFRDQIDGHPSSLLVNAHLECFGQSDETVVVWKASGPGHQDPNETASAPSYRSAGIALVRSDADRSMSRAEGRVEDLYEQPEEPGSPLLVASDLILGYVPEIWAPPAKDPNGKPAWYSLTKRQETFPLLNESRAAYGHLAIAVAEASDAAPSDQSEPERQGTVSPSFFAYANKSLGAVTDATSFSLPEGDDLPKMPDDPLHVKLSPVPRTLPLVRYSDIGRNLFEYSVRCRYVDLAGNSRSQPNGTLGPSEIRLQTSVERQESISAPRVLTIGRLDRKRNPGSNLKTMVAREHTCDSRMFIPPRVSAEMAVKYGKLIDGRLDRGHLPRVQLNEYAEVPEEKCISSSSDDDLQTPTFRWRRMNPTKPGFYYFPDPAANFVCVTVHTFYSLYFHLDPLRVVVPFYRDSRWPDAEPIQLTLCSLSGGQVEPKIKTAKTKISILMPTGWTGYAEISSGCADSSTQTFGSRHFAAFGNGGESIFTTFFGDQGRLIQREISTRPHADADTESMPEVFREIVVLADDVPSAIGPFVQGEQAEIREKFKKVSDHFSTLCTGLKSIGTSCLATNYLLSGASPAISPTDRIELVCPTQRPILAPTLRINGVHLTGTEPRPENSDSVKLSLESTVDEKSTAELSVMASWRRLQDDPALGEPKIVWDRTELKTLKIPAPRTYKPTTQSWNDELSLGTPSYRRVKYKVDALTRFSQYYHQQDRRSLCCKGSNNVQIDHLNCARPRVLPVKHLVPTINWTSSARHLPNNPKWMFESSARYGIRVYLGRGWQLGEQMGVIVHPTLSEHDASEMNAGRIPIVRSADDVPEDLRNSVSQWGADPTVESEIPNDLPNATDFFGYRSVGAELPLPEADGSNRRGREVSVVGFNPKWDKEKQLWYCDIGLRRIPSYGCFIRLALARYQPKSIKDFELSSVVLADYMQVRPERIVNVLRDPTDQSQRTLKVIISEPRGKANTPNSNHFHVRVEQPCASSSGTRIGWIEDEDIRVTEEGNLHMPDALWAGKIEWPGRTGRRRIVISEFEQWEYMDSDRNLQTRKREVFCNVLEI